jgi:transposase
MVGTSDPPPALFSHINLEQIVPADHPLRTSRPWIDTDRIRTLCEPLSVEVGRPSIPPAQRVLALLGGDLLEVPSERVLGRELTGHLGLRWLIGLDVDTALWDRSPFSQNLKRLAQ